ncbi:hypothetical protein QL285_040937 [Trifolium repens]|nr:hypothetical protein QL285_040937 [Trifolium repens]
MFGISSSSNTILWNGSKTEAFSPARGLRQGDPLSPYLFVLCMERLGAMISKYVSDGTWKPMQISRDGTKLSHLFFADDVLLFSKATTTSARVVKEVLDNFCSSSGLKVSFEKSKFCTSAGVCQQLRDRIGGSSQIRPTDHFDKYLGFKMFYGKVSKQDFSDIYDRVSSKLASWKSRLLNKPGRVVLANSVISSLPSYYMQINWLPQGMCDDLDKTVRRFIWKGTGDTGMHLVGWNKITQPRRFGGLGVRIARLQNVSLLGKLVWEILHSPAKLWVNLFKEKYLKGRFILNMSIVGGSVVWNSILKAVSMLRDGFTLKIGDGSSKFWYDSWVYKNKLCSMVPFVDIHDTDLKIKEVWDNGMWNFDDLYTNIPDSVKAAITRIKPCLVEDIPDVWVWQDSSSGIFTTKEAYEWLLQPVPVNSQENWKWIWKSKLPANIQFFIWQMLHKSIPTRGVLNHRRVCSSNICPRCSTSPETIEHCLFWCVDAIGVWKACGLDNILLSLQSGDLFNWCRRISVEYGIVVFIIMWVIWCARNNFLFNGRCDSVTDNVAKILSLRTFCDSAFDTHLLDAAHSSIPRYVSWSRPAVWAICLNVDGSLLGSLQSAGFRGLLRNNTGTFLGGFYGEAMQPNVLYAEIMAIFHGLEFCWNKGFRNVVCLSDSLQAVTLIKEGVLPYHSFANELQKICQLIRRSWTVVVDHTLREGNKCADHLAKLGAASNSSLVLISEPPLELVSLLQADAGGVSVVRM